MKNFSSLFCLLLLTTIVSAQTSLILNWDIYKSPIASAENLLTAHHAAYKFTESKIKTKYWEEDKWHKKLGGIGCRLTKSILLDNQVDWLVHIHQKHVFGTGFRYREFGFQRNSYKLNLFLPFGGGAGFARSGSLAFSRRFGVHENAAILIGGMEGAAVLSDKLRDKWLQSGEIHYRESLLFLASFHDYTANIYWIILTSEDGRMNSINPMEAVNNFLKNVNGQHEFEEEKDYQLTINDLGVRSSIDLINTFHLFAVFTYVNRYLVEGDKSFKYP